MLFAFIILKTMIYFDGNHVYYEEYHMTIRKKILLPFQILAILSFVIAFIMYFLHAYAPPNQQIGNVSFIVLFYLFVFCISMLITLKYTRNKQTIFIVGTILLLGIILRILGADHQTYDYSYYLHNWIEDYKNKSLKDCFVSTISNYTPPYNYFLILFSRLPIYDLYLLKALSTIFELLSAIMIVLLIAKITKKSFNVYIFAIMLLLPTSLGNSSWWAQCDTIYTFFGLCGLYYALCHKSKLSFLFFGISSAFKLQSIILYPVVLLLLLFKDEETHTTYLKWKDIYMFIISFVILMFFPVLLGRPFREICGIYLGQTEENARISGNCPNFNIWIRMIAGNNIATLPITIFTTLVTVIILLILYIFMIKKYKSTMILPKKDIPLICLLFTFTIVYFMTRMNDRFFMYSAIFSFICLCVYKDDILRLSNITNITSLVFVMLTDRYYALCVVGASINIVTILCYGYCFYKYFIKKDILVLNQYLTTTLTNETEKINE